MRAVLHRNCSAVPATDARHSPVRVIPRGQYERPFPVDVSLNRVIYAVSVTFRLNGYRRFFRRPLELYGNALRNRPIVRGESFPRRAAGDKNNERQRNRQ